MLVKSIPKVSVQKLFALALSLKITSSGLGLWLNSPWLLGLAIPISIMIAYMVVGYYAREDDVSTEKFADSCYYIGFIFTITSIIFCLFDLPNLGAGDGMRNIALRFGAAMVSTVLGMGVRVYLVSFTKDAYDAIKDSEQAVLDASRLLASQLGAVVDEMRKFEAQIVDASKISVENVNRQISELGQNYAQSLNGFYHQLTEENKAAFKELLQEVRQATLRLSDSVDTYSGGMRGNLESIERKVSEFADVVTFRLTNTTFPDDYFARELKAPLDQLKSEAANLGSNVGAISSLVENSSVTLANVLKQITSKTKKSQDAMDAVIQLSEQHRTLLNNAGLQLSCLVTLAERMEQIDAALKGALQVVGTNSNTSAELLAGVASLSIENSALRLEIKGAMETLTAKLDANSTLATDVIQKLESQAGGLRSSAIKIISSLEKHSGSSEMVAQQLTSTNNVAGGIVEKLQIISANTVQVASNTRHAAQNASAAAELAHKAAMSSSQTGASMEKVVTQVIGVASQVRELDTALRSQTGSLIETAQKLHQFQENQPTTIANAVAQAMASRLAFSEIASPSKGTVTSPVPPPTPLNF